MSVAASSTSSAIPELYGGRRAALSLDVIIVGCGLAGLATAHTLSSAGHHVTLLESSSDFGVVGAGIQVSPNFTRLLMRWGLGEKLKQHAVRPEAIAFRRWKNGDLVGWTKWGADMETEYGAPYYHVHRHDLHQMLIELIAPRCTIRLNSSVVSVNPDAFAEKSTATLSTGELLHADLIIGSDGVRSLCRNIVLGKPTRAKAVGDAAYRAIVPTDIMMKDPDLRSLVENPELTVWLGPDKHLAAYNIRAKREFNIVMVHPDDGSVESWTAEGSADKMRAAYAGWEPRIEKLLGHVKKTLKRKLMDREPLATWVHPTGRLVLLGDACHPMLPFRAQGAAMAIEDAAVLGSLLSRISHRAELTPLLYAYERLRLARTAETQRQSGESRDMLNLHDGPEQERRDTEMGAAMAAERARISRSKGAASAKGVIDAADAVVDLDSGFEGNQNQWADRAKSIEQFAYDADAAADSWWNEGGHEICAQAVRLAVHATHAHTFEIPLARL